jgi:endoglucanase
MQLSKSGVIAGLIATLFSVAITAQFGGDQATAMAGDASGQAVFPGGLYREAGTPAELSADRFRAEGDLASAALIDKIASQPTAVWLGDWYSDSLLKSVIARHVTAARTQGTTLVFVTYAIPFRDCGGFSSGGFDDANYLSWNRTIATALAGTHAVILIEPDSLAMLSNPKCSSVVATRLPLLRQSVDILSAAGLTTYLDGGNSRWLSPDAQAAWLVQAGISEAHGFFTNVAGFNPVQIERDYAGKVSSRVGWKHFVIDISRNGAGWTGDWCNPPGAGLGQNPLVSTDTSKLDALLWVKHPGASDGTCNGGPAAGSWFESGALALARNR